MTTPVQNRTDEVVGGKCTHCGRYGYPHRRWCSACGSEVEQVELSGAATLQAWTVIRVPPRGFTAPYVVGYARLAEGPRVLVRLAADPERLAPGAALALSRSRLQAGGGRRSVGLEAALAEGPGA